MKQINIMITALLLFCASGYAQDYSTFINNGKYGVRDASGKIIIPAKYDKIGYFSEGLVSVKSGDKYGYIDTNGRKVIPIKLKYETVYEFSEGVALVLLNHKYGLIDKTGKEIVPPKYDYANPFRGDWTDVRLDNKYGYIDKTGKEVIPVKYDGIGSFSEGLAPAKLAGKYGYIDKAGNMVIPAEYDDAKNFSNGIALVKSEGKYGYIDKTGKENVKYDCIEWNSDHTFAKVWSDGKYGRIDKTGKEVAPLQYPNHTMQIVWENILISNIKQIKDRLSKFNKTTLIPNTPFKFNSPYLILSISHNECKQVSIVQYSEKELNEHSVNNLKTLIITYDYLDYSFNYTPKDTSYTPFNMKFYGTYIMYFDVARKEFIGYDEIVPDAPLETTNARDRYNSSSDIIKKIVSHLTIQ